MKYIQNHDLKEDLRHIVREALSRMKDSGSAVITAVEYTCDVYDRRIAELVNRDGFDLPLPI